MKTLIIFLILTAASLSAFAQGAAKCFQTDALQGKQIVRFRTNGNSVAGTFEFENGESELAKPYKFSGTLAGGILRVKFENNEMPDVSPSEMKSLNWEFATKSGAEILRIKFYGKNYETNKYADYFADFEPCEPNYDALLKAAKLVRFASGKSSATALLDFKNASERKVFSINARKGQTLSIDAAGCKISVYLPGGGLYEFVEWQSESGDKKTFASAAIDRLTLKAIPQTGNYLIVLGKLAEEAQPRAASFKITN
jgi:hypothetical protein